uniref:Uncharacterized protein n=1 Tax=Rhizophora mucronata TaxID=61149 RepID=A0A2P2R288_RHIMU
MVRSSPPSFHLFIHLSGH